MGINVQSCCHLCRVRVFHYRSDESLTMMPFYYKHRKCLAADPTNIETKEDQNQEQAWMSEYPCDKDIQVLGRKYYCKRVKRNDMEQTERKREAGLCYLCKKMIYLSSDGALSSGEATACLHQVDRRKGFKTDRQKIIDLLWAYPKRAAGYRWDIDKAQQLYGAILPYIGVPRGATFNCVCGESISLDSALSSYRNYAKDDLAEIKSALGLPDDTPEPLVGAIWRLQQRIEDLEEKFKDKGCEA